jgi:hypothetical protein
MDTIFDYQPTSNIFKLEDDISALIKDKSVHFSYVWGKETNTDQEWVIVNVYTYNSDTETYFLLEKFDVNVFKTSTGSNPYATIYDRFQNVTVNQLEKLKETLKKMDKGDLRSFTIIWSNKDDEHEKKNRSYFSAYTLGHALRKLYADRDESYFMIHEVKLNPSS